MGCWAFETSQTGTAAMFLLSWTFVASMLKYSATESKPPGAAAFGLNDGVAGAARAVAPSTDANNIEARIFAVRCM